MVPAAGGSLALASARPSSAPQRCLLASLPGVPRAVGRRFPRVRADANKLSRRLQARARVPGAVETSILVSPLARWRSQRATTMDVSTCLLAPPAGSAPAFGWRSPQVPTDVKKLFRRLVRVAQRSQASHRPTQVEGGRVRHTREASRSAPSRPRALRESRVAGRGTHVRGRAALPRHLTWAMPESVARAGVEPATFRFSGGRSYQLSYLAVRARAEARATAWRAGNLTPATRAASNRLHRPDRGCETPQPIARLRRVTRPRRDSNPRPPP